MVRSGWSVRHEIGISEVVSLLLACLYLDSSGFESIHLGMFDCCLELVVLLSHSMTMVLRNHTCKRKLGHHHRRWMQARLLWIRAKRVSAHARVGDLFIQVTKKLQS